uniref:Uncharacterized protein n=1 Tax=Anguilla anguilla TaxID=7936 RepID=A0A0E9SBK4_ANGAN
MILLLCHDFIFRDYMPCNLCWFKNRSALVGYITMSLLQYIIGHFSQIQGTYNNKHRSNLNFQIQ